MTTIILLTIFISVTIAALAGGKDPERHGLHTDDPCAYAATHDHGPHEDFLMMEMRASLGANWGYSYGDLLVDLERWRQSPYVTIDSIGTSLQDRAIWEMRITDTETAGAKQTVFIHARTHPGEVQAWWVTNEIITALLADSDYARRMRAATVFYIVPMLNPDGVELELPRHNANDLDLEREWDKNPMQPEAAALKRRFETLMASEQPIKVALNMHSAFNCKRYFVYHAAGGTSEEFAAMQRDFIERVRSFFPGGIEPWDFFVSWNNAAPTHFPESWYWHNFGADVMALTYEDMNCSDAGEYEKTANALLRGVGSWLGVDPGTSVVEKLSASGARIRLSVAPNPAVDRSMIAVAVDRPVNVRLTISDMTGRIVTTLYSGRIDHNELTFAWPGNIEGQVAAGMYFAVLTTEYGERIMANIIVTP